MEFVKYELFDKPYWFCGIYKISEYEYYGDPLRAMPKGEHCYQAYRLNSAQWGDYIDRQKQHNKALTFAECVALCEDHAKTHKPDKRELSRAEKARQSFLKETR